MIKKEKPQIEKIRDDDGEVRGYRLGAYYLMKIYNWDNTYSWVINKTGDYYYTDCEFWRLVDDGEVEIINSCKEGKARLLELHEKLFHDYEEKKMKNELRRQGLPALMIDDIIYFMHHDGMTKEEAYDQAINIWDPDPTGEFGEL